MSGRFFSWCFSCFYRRSGRLMAAVLLVLALSMAGLWQLELGENIAAMLPDGKGGVATDFRLLQKAPFARKVLISLEATGDTEGDLLIEAADGLASALPPEIFTRVATGPRGSGADLPAYLLDALPSLSTEADLEKIGGRLGKRAVADRIEEGRARLLSPEGWWLKDLFRRDPLELRSLSLEKLRYLNPIEKTHLRQGHFVSADGRHALLIAETPVSITDAAGSRALLSAVDDAVADLPEGIEATLVSGHPYTVANADAIRGDLGVVIGVSAVAIALLFLLFLRSWRAVFVFAVPVAVLGLSAGAVALFYPSVSGITIGFGAVLLGITVDFALHVYFTLRHGGDIPERLLEKVTRPVLFGGLTTLGAFAVLLTSDLPGQRQLAVFSMAGIAAALLLSLVVLPHLVGGRQEAVIGRRWRNERAMPMRRTVIGVWALLLVAGLLMGTRVPINGELRALGYVPVALQAAEQQVRSTWGDVRGKALVFVEGENWEQALEANDRLFAYLSARLPAGELVSLSPLLPAGATQQQNRERWIAFWKERRGDFETDLFAAAESKGLTPAAFAPFLASFDEVPPPVTREALESAGLADLLAALTFEEKGVGIVTLVPDRPEVLALFEAGAPPEARLVSQGRFASDLGDAIRGDFVRFILLAAAAVTLLLVILFRRPGKVLLALVPVASGLAAMFGLMGVMGMEFNLFNIVATILILGLGVDYGIYMVCRLDGGEESATEKAVLVSGLTTLAGFGALVLASHPALHSIGVTVLLGIGAAVPAALLVIPALYRRSV